MLVSATEIINKSWDLYRAHWRELSIYMLLLFIPTMILILVGILGLYLSMYLPAAALINDILTLLILLAAFIFGLWTSVALTMAVKSVYKDNVVLPWKTAYNNTAKLLWPIIYTSALVTLIVIGGTLLLIIPGIIFTFWYIFSVQEIIFAGQKGLAAMSESKKLVVGRWWAVAFRFVAPALLFVLASLMLQQILIFPFTYMNSILNVKLISNIISSLVNAAVAPLTVASVIILYFSAKENTVSTSITPHIEPPKL